MADAVNDRADMTRRAYAGVHLLDTPFCLDRRFDYSIPRELEDSVFPGVFVSVPFGTANRRRIAVVTELTDTPSVDNTKPISAVCPQRISLREEDLGLCHYMREQTLCSLGDAVRTVIPAASLASLAEYFRKNADKELPQSGKFSPRTLFVYEYIASKQHASTEALKAKFGASVKENIKELADGGYILRELELRGGMEEKTVSVYSLAVTADVAKALSDGEKVGEIKLRSEIQTTVLKTLLSDGELLYSELCDRTGATGAQINALVKKGLLLKSEKTVTRNPYNGAEFNVNTDYLLNDGQNRAFETLSALADSGEARAALLYGITGSGKTCVIVKAIDKMLSQGRGVILLLPEIALTPQTLAIFCSRYGDRVAVIHSSLSAGERFDAYLRIREGKADVVIGTRSAVFAPVKNLGLIVIDEEQEHTYKSDSNPKYHARDIARWRCSANKALMLLASATPSLESYQKATDGKYTLIKLTERYGAAKLPRVMVSDMRRQTGGGNLTPIGTELAAQLIKTINAGEQAILFINRRGYNNFVSCRSCGKPLTCPNCSVSFTYHTKPGNYDDGVLVCHWCGTKIKLPSTCPECGSAHLVRFGYGTQRIEQELSGLLGDKTKIIRMDADTVSDKFAYDRLLGDFRAGRADLLLGTQMVTKGHDFPAVTLVGVLLADASLYLDDYRASERTFSMLTQVIGRAGRADKEGIAVIQTNNPDSDIIKLACAQDYETFFKREIKLRKQLVFPPFCDIALLSLTHGDEKELLLASNLLFERLNILSKTDYADVPLVVFGPFEAPVYKVDGKFRMRIIAKCKLNRRCRELFGTLLFEFSKGSATKPLLSVDFNPTNI